MAGTQVAVGAGTMLERSAQVAALSSLLASARDGAGGCIVIEGGAGIGKSRLLAEGLERPPRPA